MNFFYNTLRYPSISKAVIKPKDGISVIYHTSRQKETKYTTSCSIVGCGHRSGAQVVYGVVVKTSRAGMVVIWCMQI